MDNLTHTIIGLIAGESVAQSQSTRPGGLPAQARRVLLIALTAIASNLPDLDLVVSYRGFTRSKLDYMLGHRGYTHTVIGCLLLAAALYALTDLWMRWRRLSPSPRDRLLLASAAVLGTALHLSMDFLNSYGVHPFWPAQNHWYYGDSVFIVEPLYWIASAPLFFVQKSWLARGFVGFSVFAAIALSLFTGLVPVPLVIGMTLAAALLLAAGSRISSRIAALVSLSAYVLITAAFITSGRLAASEAEGLPSFGQVLDHALTPMPANSVCWDLLLLQENEGTYRVRHAVLSIAPTLIAAADCPQRISGVKTTADLKPVAVADTTSVHWLGEVSMPAQVFEVLTAKFCDAAALMRFARVPFTAQLGEDTVIGDLRFDREPDVGFSELLLPGEGGDQTRPVCEPTPPWTPPRNDLLRTPPR